MAMLRRLLSQPRRLPPSSLSPVPHFRRLFSSEPAPIEAVAYLAKPKTPEENDQSEPSIQPPTPPSQPPSRQPEANGAAARDLTREELRYLKDTPVISPVSYPKRVAPLPEDRGPAAAAVADGEGRVELEREWRKIEKEATKIRRVFRAVEEEEKEVPFPILIKVEKKEGERKIYDLRDAIQQVKANARRKFDETVEAHVNLGIDRRRSDLGVSGAVVLPHGTGKIVKVAVFADGAAADEAREAGADIVGGEELINEIRTTGKINFDKCIATHSMMQRVTSIGKILRGLTPNAKKGTVTNNIGVAVKETKQGLLDFKMKDSILHVGLGKVSFSEESLHENVGAFVNALLLAKPAGLKKTSKYVGYVNSFHLCSTMGPGFAISIQSLSKAADLYNKLHPQ